MATQGQDNNDEDWDFKVSLKPRTKRTAATVASLGTLAAVLVVEQKTGISLADVVFAAKVVSGK